jgi:hypothetical protein
MDKISYIMGKKDDSGLEKKLTIEELRIKHADVLNNPAIRAIAYWKDPLDKLLQDYPPMTLEEQIDKANERAKTALPYMLKLSEESNGYRNGV